MATLPPKSEKPNNKMTRMGNLPMEVQGFDAKTNTLDGINLRSGEQVSVRLATAAEISNFFVNRNKHPTEDARNRLAYSQIENRPDLRTLNSKLTPGLEGQTVQLQGAMKKLDGEIIARWAKAVTGDLELDVSYRGEVEFVKVQTKNDDWRRANFVQTRQAEPVTKETLDNSLQNMAVSASGQVAEGEVQSRPLAIMQDISDNVESAFLYSPSVGTGSERKLLTGADGPDAAFQNIKLSAFNHRLMAAVAGRVDIPAKDLNGYDQLPDDQREAVDAIHEMSANGQLEVAIAPGFSSNLLPNRSKAVIASESAQRGSGSLTERGFFEADISMRTYLNGDDNSPVDARMKEAVETGFLHHPSNPQFVKRDRDAVATTSIQFARDNAGGMDALMKPAPSVEAAIAASADAEREAAVGNKQTTDAAMGGPGM